MKLTIEALARKWYEENLLDLSDAIAGYVELDMDEVASDIATYISESVKESVVEIALEDIN